MDGGATEIEGIESVEDLGRLERWWNIPGMVIWSLILFGSFLLNATLLLAILKRPGLRTISNRFVMNLAASNLLTVTLMNSLLIFDGENSNPGHCSFAEGTTALVTTSSILSVLLIALDQYLAVVDPLRYRTRIDKLKCAILIFTVWTISILFTLLAALNPNPKSLWLACNNNINISNSSSINLEILIETEKNDSIPLINDNIELITNKTFINKTILNDIINTNNDNIFIVTYGFIYTMTAGLIIYLLPFIGVCWIYINIYLAAHKNSKRTRQNGSRPILSTCSFTDDYYCPIRHDLATINDDNMRRIPKISSLSSIDESIETATSQLPIQCSNINNKSTINHDNNDYNINNNNDDNTNDNINNSAVIFTVGEKKVCVKPKLHKQTLITKDNIKVPISTLKRQFLCDNNSQQQSETINSESKNHFTNVNDDKRKSSHDLIYNNVINDDLLRLDTRNDDFISDSSDSEDECITKTINDGVQYPPLMNNCDFEVRDDELMRNFKQKVQNSLSSRDNILMIRNEGHISNNNNHNCHNNTSNDYGNKLTGDSNSINGLTANTTPIVTITPPNKIPLHRVSSTRSTTSYINCLKYRISNASLFRYREETRAARISALVIVMGFICWTPYFVVSLLKNLSIIVENDLPHEFDIVAMSFLIFATYVTPLLFGYRSRRVKRELRKFFCFKKELSYKNNRSLMAKKVLKRRHSGNLSNLEMDSRYNIFNCVYGRNKWPKEKVQFVQVPETALAVETCRSSFSSGASTQISSTSTDEN